MNAITLESLGLSQEDIAERVVDRIVDRLLNSYVADEDDEDVATSSKYMTNLQELVHKKINESVENIAAKHVLPNIETYLEGLCLQETNSWGEKKGKPVTFIEYLVQRAEAYMLEEVNYEGKSKGQNGSYSWSKSGTRISYLVNQHLQYSIQTAMQNALKDANSHIVGGLEQAIKIKLAEVQNSIKVGVTVK